MLRASIIVDSIPASHLPASIISAHFAISALSRWATSVGLSLPLGLADGATTGMPAQCNNSWQIGLAGTRNATLSSPALAREQIGLFLIEVSTILIGPGQKASASCCASFVVLTKLKAASLDAQCTINGLN